MKHSDSIASIAKALAAAQGQMAAAVKDRVNPYYKSKYADLSSVIESIRIPFSTNGLSYTQGTSESSEKTEVIVDTLLMHESGEWIQSALTIPITKADAQGYGIAVTYGRRYALQAICGQASEDDDGNGASGHAGDTVNPSSRSEKKEEVLSAQNIDKFYEAIFKGGALGDQKNKIPHRIVLEIQNKEYEYTCFSRPPVLKEIADWSQLLNLPCRFKFSKTERDGKTYRNLLDLVFTLPDSIKSE